MLQKAFHSSAASLAIVKFLTGLCHRPVSYYPRPYVLGTHNTPCLIQLFKECVFARALQELCNLNFEEPKSI